MPTKNQLSDEVNEILGMDADWSKLNKDDLELFYELLDNGSLIEDQTKHVVAEHGKQKLEEEIDEWHPGKILSKLI